MELDLQTYIKILGTFTDESKRAFIEAKESGTHVDSYGPYARGYRDAVENCEEKIIKILGKNE